MMAVSKKEILLGWDGEEEMPQRQDNTELGLEG